MSQDLEVVIEPYKKIVVHEILEYNFADLVDLLIAQGRSSGGMAIPIGWCNGIAFQAGFFNPASDEIIRENLRGVIHFSAVSFAVKDKFEREIIRPTGTVRLIDQSINRNFVKLTQALKGVAKLQG